MRKSPATILAVFGGYTALALFLSVANSLTYLSTGNSPNWKASIQRSLAEWYGWAALTPLILWLSSRWPLSRASWLRNGTVHIVAMLVIGIAKLLVDQQLRAWIFGFRPYLLLSNLAFNVIVYWAIVAVAHGLHSHRSARERELRASQLEARLAETRLQLLSMQLQPHFLFNTLNAISELVHEDPDTADAMITGLSTLLRETLAAGDMREVTLRRELALMRSYVDIQRARFGERLHVTVTADDAALDAAVPALLLQPLVENSIRHGLASRAAAGCIDVAVRRTGNRLVLSVQDDGAGLDAAMSREGIGLGNTRARLAALFGPECSLEMTSPDQGGVLVTISIPYRSVEAA